MKKTAIFVSVVLMLVAFTGCSTGSQAEDSFAGSETEQVTVAPETTEVQNETETEAETQTDSEIEVSTSATVEVTAAGVMEYLLGNTSNIGTYVEYDEATDVNGLLGRPGQYTSKINFEITTLEQTDPKDPKGGSIEVFATAEDAVTRYEYIQSLAQSMPLLAEYDYLNGCVLLRIDYDVLPSEEMLYEEAVAAYLSSLQ